MNEILGSGIDKKSEDFKDLAFSIVEHCNNSPKRLEFMNRQLAATMKVKKILKNEYGVDLNTAEWEVRVKDEESEVPSFVVLLGDALKKMGYNDIELTT